jgi:hypothetical protein
MDQGTVQTIIDGGILVTLISIAKSTSTIAKKTGDGGSGTIKGGSIVAPADDSGKKPTQ